MSEIKDAIDSGLKNVKFSEDMKRAVMENAVKKETIRTPRSTGFMKRVVPVMVCLLVCISLIAAGKIKLWDKYVAEQYNIEDQEQVQEETIGSGLADTTNRVAEDNGIRIEVLQSIASGSGLQIYLKIQAENEEVVKQILDTNPDFELSYEKSMFSSGGGGMENYYTGEGMKTMYIEGEKAGQEGPEYEIYSIYSNVMGDTLDGDTVHLTIHNFIGNSQTSPDKVVEGDWEFSWTINAADNKCTIVFDKEYKVYGKSFKLNKVVLNETGIKVYLDRKLIDEQGILAADILMTRKPEKYGLHDSELTGTLTDNYDIDAWTGSWGIPLEVWKDMTPEEIEEAYDQIEAGTYEGEYLDQTPWVSGDINKIMTGPFDNIHIWMKDGTEFQPTNSSGGIHDEEETYILSENYVGYLDIQQVEAIQIGDCMIPLFDGTEE